jgi:hypothetical protein
MNKFYHVVILSYIAFCLFTFIHAGVVIGLIIGGVIGFFYGIIALDQFLTSSIVKKYSKSI